MNAPASIITTSALAIGYAKRVLARDITFAVQPGTALAILGPNGSGKTTLFRTLLGLLPARSGEVRIADVALPALTVAEIARRIGYVPQTSASFSHFNVLEVVEMARAPHLAWYAQPGVRDREIALASLSRLGIADFAYREYTELSGGERQLVMIARALTSEATCLLLDEPTASLDFGNRLMILDTLANLKAQGVAIIFTTHEPDQARRLCDNVGDQTLTISRDGEIHIGATAAVLAPSALARLYGLPESVFDGLLHNR
jgi:iron complex transport system ATP-binding protein